MNPSPSPFPLRISPPATMLVSDLSEEILIRPPPVLPEEILEEILIHLPPDDPGCLFRASVVCKPWRSLVTSSGFARRYRKFHRTPPLLGFFEIHHPLGCWFAPSSPTSPFPPIHPDSRDLFVVDSRHGLVLLRTPGWMENEDPPVSFIVWDPVGRRQWEFPPPEFAANIRHDNAVVLCAADHLGCRGGPFTVAYVGTDDSGTPHASVYSSETRAWSAVATIPDENLEINRCRPKALVGNVLYFACYDNIILWYDILSGELSTVEGPMGSCHDSVLMKTDEGMLGCTMVKMKESELCLWSMETGPDGAVAWTRCRFIELEKRLLPCYFSHVIGFVDGPGVFYLWADSGIFTVELKSGRVKKISINRFTVVSDFTLIPYMSFYTPDQAGPRTLPSTMASSSDNVEPDRDKCQDSLLPHSSGQVGDEHGKGEEGDGWEEVSAEKVRNEEGHQEEKVAQELFDNGSKFIKDRNFVCAVDYLRRALKIRVAHHGKLSPKCFSTYLQYGHALVGKTKLENVSALKQESVKQNVTGDSKDLDLPWRMLHVARSIFEKSPGSTMEKFKIFALLAEVSVQGEDIDYSLIACFKALAILEHLVDRDYCHIFDLNLQIRFAFELESKIRDAQAISLCKSCIENLKRANEDLLAGKGDNASATEVGSSSLAKYIEYFTGKLLSALEKKLEDLEQAISTPVPEASGKQHVGNDVPGAGSSTSSQFSGSSNTMSTAESAKTDVEAAGRGIKRANVDQISSEPSPKKFTEDSPWAESDSSHSTDGQSRSTAQDGSVSE